MSTGLVLQAGNLERRIVRSCTKGQEIDMDMDERVAISNKLSLEDKLWFIMAWANDIIVRTGNNDGGELDEEVPVCINGTALQLNMREEMKLAEVFALSDQDYWSQDDLDALVAQAQQEYGSDNITVDQIEADAQAGCISVGDDGVWVKAWVRLPEEEEWRKQQQR